MPRPTPLPTPPNFSTNQTLLFRSNRQPIRMVRHQLERVAGIEPASSAWKAEVLPLNHRRAHRSRTSDKNPSKFRFSLKMVVGDRIRTFEGIFFRFYIFCCFTLGNIKTLRLKAAPVSHFFYRYLIYFRETGANPIPATRVFSAKSPAFGLPIPKPHCGAATRSRTLDLLITSELLYQLSYGGQNGGGILKNEIV